MIRTTMPKTRREGASQPCARCDQLLPCRRARRSWTLSCDLSSDRAAMGRSPDRPRDVDRDASPASSRRRRPARWSMRRRAKRLVMVVAAHHGHRGLAVAAAVSELLAGRGVARASRMPPASIFPPAIAAVSLGIVGHAAFTARIGRNETFNHAGNAVAAAARGRVAAYLFGPSVVFYLLAAMSIASIVSILAIPEQRDRPRSRPRAARKRRREAAARAAVRTAHAADLSPAPGLRGLRDCCSTSRMRRCCRWLDKSSRCRTRTSAPA